MGVVNRLFSEGFRVFFLAAGLYALFTGLVWELFLSGLDAAPVLGPPPVMWHAHEMIFGYASAAIGGFFLTAVPSWTNTQGARQGFIALAAALWLAGRLAIWYAAALPPLLVAVVDLAFLPILALKILTQLLKRPKPQNVMFLLFLVYLWVSNLLVHLEWLGVTDDTAAAGLRGGLITLCALIAVLGGRVTPAFTRNAMKRAGVPEVNWPSSHKVIERLSLVCALALPPLTMLSAPDWLIGSVALLFGGVQGVRIMRWGGAWCWNQPILLALHLGMAMLALGMILTGLARFGIGNELAGLHVLGIGCVGGMTLAVMSRAALGHSGRALIAPRPMAVGYALITLAAFTRWAGVELDIFYLPALLATGGLWIAAFGLFLFALWPALIGPRVPVPAR
ncbi:NnrS family protein [Ruegeria sp. 2012CJ41-6]|uniref:NnrS family protein n=1 Tax=Ruegeria spongiae TaxID=2942209 RepID=A0ABT0Q0X6_9RHOB|nr:NnrS family protein [Ruegeria spongiae]MCL6282589.1 NnrS family protein [Ruegeria spongiae]